MKTDGLILNCILFSRVFGVIQSPSSIYIKARTLARFNANSISDYF